MWVKQGLLLTLKGSEECCWCWHKSSTVSTIWENRPHAYAWDWTLGDEWHDPIADSNDDIISNDDVHMCKTHPRTKYTVQLELLCSMVKDNSNNIPFSMWTKLYKWNTLNWPCFNHLICFQTWIIAESWTCLGDLGDGGCCLTFRLDMDTVFLIKLKRHLWVYWLSGLKGQTFNTLAQGWISQLDFFLYCRLLVTFNNCDLLSSLYEVVYLLFYKFCL